MDRENLDDSLRENGANDMDNGNDINGISVGAIGDVPSMTVPEKDMEKAVKAEEKPPKKPAGQAAVMSSAQETDEAPDLKLGFEEEKPPRKSRKKGLLIGMICLVVLLLLGGAGYIFLVEPAMSEEDLTRLVDSGTFYEGITVAGVNVTGMTLDQAKEALGAVEAERSASIVLPLTLDDEKFEITAEDLTVTFDTDDVLHEALLVGRMGTMAERWDNISTTKNEGRSFEIDYQVDVSPAKAKVEKIAKDLYIASTDATMEVNKDAEKPEDEKFKYTKEVDGRSVNAEQLFSEVTDRFSGRNYEPMAIAWAPVPAVVTEAMLKEQTTLVASFSTSFAKSPYNNKNRVFNIVKCAMAFDGYEIKAGENFDINKVVGPRTYDGGWKGAPGISGGQYRQEAGGGVCQVSSTLFNVALLSCMEIVDARPHSWPLGYVDEGRDATISTGGPDLIFKNPRDTSVFLFCFPDEDKKTLTIEMYGMPFEEGWDKIDLETKKIATLSPSGGPSNIPDGSQPVGYKKEVIKRRSGSKWEVYRIYYKNGEEAKREKCWEATYRAFNGQYIVGAKQPTPPPAPPTDPASDPPVADAPAA